LPNSYTPNQTGAISCLMASFMWGLTAYFYAIWSSKSHPIYILFLIIGWILIPFYIKLFRLAFVIGIFILAVPMCYLAFLTELLGTAPWFTFSRGLYDFTYVVWFLISIACIYFSYQTFKELGKIGRVKLVYTSNQTGAIACWLAIITWGLTAYGATTFTSDLSRMLYMILILIGWILLPFYIKLIRGAFIGGMYFLAIAMAYLVITPSLQDGPIWYTFSRGVFDFTFILFYMISFVGLYFNYRSWKELLE